MSALLSEYAEKISIHALREEGDAFRSAFSCVEP